MSSKKKETENGSNESGRKIVGTWVTWDEFQGLSGHGHHMFISSRPPPKRAPESDSEKAESDVKASDS
mgnify:CR=1 FL=1